MARVRKPKSIEETRKVIDAFIADSYEEDVVIAPPEEARCEILWLIASQYHRAIDDPVHGPRHITCNLTKLHEGRCYTTLRKCFGRGYPELAERFRPTTYKMYLKHVDSSAPQ